MVDLITQLRYFKAVEKKLRRKLGAERSKALISSAVYLLSIGGNDYLSPFTFNSSFYDKFSNQEYVAMVFGNMTQFIQVLKYYNYNLFINTLELQLFKYLILIGWCVCVLMDLVSGNVQDRSEEIWVCNIATVGVSSRD